MCLPDLHFVRNKPCCRCAPEFRSFARLPGGKFRQRSQPCPINRWEGSRKLWRRPKLWWLLVTRPAPPDCSSST